MPDDDRVRCMIVMEEVARAISYQSGMYSRHEEGLIEPCLAERSANISRSGLLIDSGESKSS